MRTRKRQSSKRNKRNANSPRKEDPPDIDFVESFQEKRLRRIKEKQEVLLKKHQNLCITNDSLGCGVLSQSIALLKKEEKGIKFFIENGHNSTFREIKKVESMIDKLENFIHSSQVEEQEDDFFLSRGHIYTLKQLNSGTSLFKHTFELERAYLWGLNVYKKL